MLPKFNLLESVQKYFNDPRLFEVKGFNKRLSHVEESIRRIQTMNRGLGSIPIQVYSTEENINNVIEKTRTNLAVAKSTLDNSVTELKNLLAQFNSTDKVINEIKLSRKGILNAISKCQFLSLVPIAI